MHPARIPGVIVLAAALATGGPAWAAQDPPPAPRPFRRGAVMPSFGLGGGFTRDFGTLQISAAATYFVWHGLGLGLSVSDTVFFYGRSFKESYPGIEKQTATNIFEVMPSVLWVFVPRPRFSPYVQGGVGPVVFNHGGGVHGRWRAGAGAYIGLGGAAFLALGVSFTSMFPQARCRRAFEYEDPAGNRLAVFGTSPCAFAWGPVLSLGFAFGGRDDGQRPPRRTRSRSRPEDGATPPPAASPSAPPGGGARASATPPPSKPATEPAPNAPAAPDADDSAAPGPSEAPRPTDSAPPDDDVDTPAAPADEDPRAPAGPRSVPSPAPPPDAGSMPEGAGSEASARR